MIPHSRPTIEEEDLQAVKETLTSGMLAEGALAARLAQRLNDLAGGVGGVPCGSGTQALVLALMAGGICRGSRVAMPTYACPGILAAILHLEAEPIFCDIADDLLLDLDQALHAAKSCDALIIPYVLGRWRDFSVVCGRRAVIIEDFAQFVSPKDLGFPGLRGDLAVFSLHATKVLCAGEGGVVVTSSAELAARLYSLKRIGDTGYGFNLMPLSDLQAALALAQLDRLGVFLQRRAAIAKIYSQMVHVRSGFSLPPPTAQDMHFRFPVMISKHFEMAALIDDFAKLGVAVRRPVDTLAHRFVAACSDEEFPVARDAWARCLSLPLYPALSGQEQNIVVSAFHHISDSLLGNGGVAG